MPASYQCGLPSLPRYLPSILLLVEWVPGPQSAGDEHLGSETSQTMACLAPAADKTRLMDSTRVGRTCFTASKQSRLATNPIQ